MSLFVLVLLEGVPLVLPCAGFEEVFFWSWSRAGGQRVGVLIRRPRFFCWRVKPLDGVGKLRSRGRSCWEIINYIFIKKTVWWWGRIWFILWFWLLLSTLSAVCSASLHSGAVRADQNWCHKRQRPPKQEDVDGALLVLLAQAHPTYWQASFCIFWLNYRWCVFWVPKIGPTHKRLVQGSVGWWIFGWYVSAHVRQAISCIGWWMFFGNHRGYRFPSISAISKRTWIIWIYIVTWIFFCDFLVLQLVPHISSIPFFVVFLVL